MTTTPTTSLTRSASQFEVAREAGQGELNVYNDNFFLPYGITRTSRSLTFPRDLPQAAWVKVVSAMLQQRDMLPFYIADALRFGEEAYGISIKDGVLMAGGSELLMRDLTSLQRVAPAQRRAALSEDHHIAVAGLEADGQDFVLKNAERYGLRVSQTQMDAAGLKQKAEHQKPNPDADTVKTIMQRVSLTAPTIFEFAKKLSFEEQNELSILLGNHVRMHSTGHLHMDDNAPTLVLCGSNRTGQAALESSTEKGGN
jgi:hypothetical protein